VADHVRALPAGEDRDVVRGLVLEAAHSGMSTAGDVLDALEGMTPDARRRLLDRARERGGLPSLAEVKEQAARRVSTPPIFDAPARDEAGCAIQWCSEPGCRAFPVRPGSGAVMPHPAKRWWCPEHVAGHEADMEPWTARIEFAPGGGLQFPDEVERDIAIAEREAERRAAFLEERRAARIAEWPAVEAEDAAQARALLGDNFKTPKGAQP
jgi:hypothetical protein